MTAAERQRAARLRRKEKPTPDERRWLASYEQSRGAPLRPPHVTVTPTVTPGAPVTPTPPTPAAPAVAVVAPGDLAAAAAGIVAPPPLQVDAAKVAAAAPAAPVDPGREAGAAQVVDLAAGLWRKALANIEAKTGERLFDDAFIDGVWKPAATRLAVKYLPPMNQDLNDAIAVVVPIGSTVFVARKLAQLPAPPTGGAVGTKPDLKSVPPTPAPAKPSTIVPGPAPKLGPDKVW